MSAGPREQQSPRVFCDIRSPFCTGATPVQRCQKLFVSWVHSTFCTLSTPLWGFIYPSRALSQNLWIASLDPEVCVLFVDDDMDKINLQTPSYAKHVTSCVFLNLALNVPNQGSSRLIDV